MKMFGFAMDECPQEFADLQLEDFLSLFTLLYESHIRKNK
jgi:hypothetical protein